MYLLFHFLCLCLHDCTHQYLPVLLRTIVLGPYHHFDSFKSLPVVGGVVLGRHVVPRSPEDPVPDSLVSLVIVLPVEVGRHAGVKPPAGAVVGPAVPGGVAVVVPVRRGERPVAVIVLFAEAESITCGARVTAYCQSIAQAFAGHLELLVLRIPRQPVKILQLHPQHHLPVAGQQVDDVVAQPKLPSVKLPEAGLVFCPGAVEVHAAVLAALQDCPPSTLLLHLTVHREATSAEVRGHQVKPAFCFSPEQVI